MRKREKPQISPDLFKPLLSFDKIERGTHIHLPLDQTETHWQHKTFIIKGIDNDKQVLIVTELNGTPKVIPFNQLHAYQVLVNHVSSKHDFKKKTRKRRQAV